MRARVIRQYQILRKLGSGAGGAVYSARDTKLLRPVVLKMLGMPKGTGDSAPQKVLREVAGFSDRAPECLRHLRGRRRGRELHRHEDNEDLAKVMTPLKRTFRQNQQPWKQLLGSGLQKTP